MPSPFPGSPGAALPDAAGSARPLLPRYAVAVGATAAALAFCFGLERWVSSNFFPIFLGAVVVSAWYGGLGPGLLSSALSLVAVDYFFIGPAGEFGLDSAGDAVKLAVFAAVGLLASRLNAQLLSARARAAAHAAEAERLVAQLQDQAMEMEQQTEEARSLSEELAKQVEESTRLSRELGAANDRLRDANAALEAERARLGGALETMGEGVALVDAGGRLAYVNAAAEQVLRAPRERLLGLVDGVPGMTAARPDGTPVEREEMPAARAFRTGNPVRGEELEVRFADGTEAALRVNASPLRDASGAVTGVVSSFADVTEARRAQAAVRESEERFRGTFEQAAVGISHNAFDGRWLRVNGCLCDMLGYTREELLRLTFQEVTHPGDLPGSVEMARRVETGEDDTYTLEKRYVRRDGGTLWVSVTVSRAQGARGEADYLIAVIQDIQARKTAEAAARESEQRFRMMADGAPVLVWVSGTDSQCSFFNQSWLDFTGRTMEQEMGTGWKAGVHPDDLARCVAVYSGAFDARRPFRMEYRLRRADGEYRWILDTGIPRFEDGAFAGYIGSCVDITERREAEEQQRFLAEAGSVLASSLDYETTLRSVARLAVPVLADYCVVDLLEDGRVRRVEATHANPALEARVRELLRFAPDLDGPGVVARAIRSATPVVDNGVTPAKLRESAVDGDHLALLLSLGATAYMVVPLLARGRVLGSMLFATTTSGRRYDAAEVLRSEELARRAALAIDHARLYEAALEANRAKADFLAVISHELRTPLNAIIGYTDLFLLGIPLPLPEGIVPQVQRVRSAAQHLLELIDETLTFARLEAGQEEVRPVPGVACSALVEEAAALVEPLAMERGLEFRAAAPQPDVEMTVDARKVRQVLVNLLGNAIKFTARGSVALTAERDGADVLFRVADTGPGIAAEHAERIFDPFWQVEQSTIRTHGGSGLGLSVARQLARLMGGDVTVQSTAGEGSVFTLRIPIAPAEE